MVFQKKANRGGKMNQKGQVKKPAKMEEDEDIFGDDFDDEMDSDDDDSDEAQKTQIKTPKGKQSLSGKRVSFQVSGVKNTPGKTPSKDNSVKKQATPGKGNIQEFKGMKQNQDKSRKSLQQDDDEEEDDDDDEDDEDFEADLDLDLEDDDDDDDDEDDDDDDEEDDDDDDDEDEEEIASKSKEQKRLSIQTQNNGEGKQKTPVKGAGKQTPTAQKGQQTPKAAQTPKSIKKEKNASPQSTDNSAYLDELERRRQRDLKQLYVGNLPKETTVEEMKSLSPDILQCIMPKKPTLRAAFAFLQFASEEKAEENYELLKNKKFKGQQLTIDFVGEKSSHSKAKGAEAIKYNLKKLFISGLPLHTTIYQIAEFFPKSYQISFNQSSSFRTATVDFLTEEEATKAFNTAKDIQIDGQSISVLHSYQSRPRFGKRKKMSKNRQEKKMKFSAKKDE